jgi:hypothetical protein
VNISIGPYFGTEEILNGSSTITRAITTNTAVTPVWPELLRLNGVAYPRSQSLDLNHIPGRHIATAYFRLQLLPELEFDPDTPGKRALYNNLNQNEELALKIDETVKRTRPDGWRGVQAREQVIKQALYSVLPDVAEVERIFLIIKAQREY